MTRTTLKIPTPDGMADAVSISPDDHGPHRPILMYPDGFGIRPALVELGERLTQHGHYVLMPNMFYRRGAAPLVDLPPFIDSNARPNVMARVMPLIHEHTADRVHRDALAFIDFLGEQREVEPRSLAVIGYCIGGLYATQTAAAFSDRVTALAAFHAPVLAAGNDVLGALRCKAHFGHAASDLNGDELTSLNATLSASGIAYTSEIYPRTTHGFTMSDTDTYDASGAERHWKNLLTLLGDRRA